MKRFAAVCSICFLFLFAGLFSAFAQDEHREEKKEEKKEEVRKEERHDQKVDEHRHISEEHFRAHFGQEHHFAVRKVVVVSGEHRFQYGGYWFGFGEPWPVGWAYTDDVYIDYVDGAYYLFNVRHPGVRIMVNVVP